MIKRAIVGACAFALVLSLCACMSGNTDTTTVAQAVSTTATTVSSIPTTLLFPAVTTTRPRPTVTAPPVSMPDDDTAWANYIVDEQYNYIADRLTKTQKNNVKKMCAAVGCKVTFSEGYTKVTDARKNVVYYSKDFGDETIIEQPPFGVLTLAKRAGKETVLVYKGVTIFDFVSYIKQIEVGGFCYSAVSSTDYMAGAGLFAGSDENGNSIIIKLMDNMIIIAITEV